MRVDRHLTVRVGLAVPDPEEAGNPPEVAIHWNQFGMRRMLWLGLLFALAAGVLAYGVIRVPVRNLAQLPVLTRGEVRLQWEVALIALVIVLAGDAMAVRLGISRVTPKIARAGQRATEPDGPVGVRIPVPLRFQRVPGWALLTTGLVSGGVLVATIYLGQPLWQKVLWTLVPWIPIFLFEEVWKYERYGFYAVFLGLAVVQVGHLGEHTAQVSQLLMFNGDLTRSHGVFGQLDFEMVHFVWDTVIWVGGAVLVYKFWDNKWLWVSLVVASLHQVEHIYLFWINQFHYDFWARGGISGIMGQGGLIGSPLSRPYLHFAYNFLVVVPVLVGLWDETKRVRDRRPAEALPALEARGAPTGVPPDSENRYSAGGERVRVSHGPGV